MVSGTAYYKEYKEQNLRKKAQDKTLRVKTKEQRTQS